MARHPRPTSRRQEGHRASTGEPLRLRALTRRRLARGSLKSCQTRLRSKSPRPCNSLAPSLADDSPDEAGTSGCADREDVRRGVGEDSVLVCEAGRRDRVLEERSRCLLVREAAGRDYVRPPRALNSMHAHTTESLLASLLGKLGCGVEMHHRRASVSDWGTTACTPSDRPPWRWAAMP